MLQTVDRALRLLLLFEEVDQEYRVGEMAEILGVDKSSASRLAATLANRGFLERAPDSEAFRIGPEIGRLGALNMGSSHNLFELARRPMESLAAETAETVNLARLEDRKVVNIAQVDGAHLVGVGDWVGWKTEPHATANGKVLLAFTDGSIEDISLQPPLGAFTRQTITKVGDLRSELERIRSAGWASTLGELEEGFNGVAVPVTDAFGCCQASLSVSGPAYRMPPTRLPEIAELCKKAANQISASLGKTHSLD
jgi:DNA-binding IclR family transcriptional regulator